MKKSIRLAELFRIKDTPQRIAAGLGLGVFTGMLPGTGPLASLFLAWILRVNRLSALLGSILTNTWLSVVTFFLAAKTGAWLLGVKWQDAAFAWDKSLKDYHWLGLLKISIMKVILPVALGYLVISAVLGIVVYLISLLLIIAWKPRAKIRI